MANEKRLHTFVCRLMRRGASAQNICKMVQYLNLKRGLLAALILLCGCTQEDNSSNFIINNNNFHVGAEGGTVYLDFQTSEAWTIEQPIVDWISIGKLSGQGDSHISLTVQPNKSPMSRQCSFSINYQHKNKDVIILQEGSTSSGRTETTILPPAHFSGKTVKPYQNGKTYASLSWEKVNNAIGYYVYYSQFSSSGFQRIGESISDLNIIVDTHNGNNYYYVVAYSAIEQSTPSETIRIFVEGTASAGDWNDIDNPDDNGGNNNGDDDNKLTIPNTPTGLSTANQGNSSNPKVYLSWTTVTNASGYRVYRSSNTSNNYSLIGTTSFTYYTDSYPLEGNNYYKVTAYNDAGESTPSSYASYYYDKPSAPNVPSNLTVSNKGNDTNPNIRIEWNAVSGAAGYRVYRSSSSSSGYSLLGDTYSNYYNDSTPLEGYNYYKVTAYNSAGESEFSSSKYFYYEKPVTLNAPTGLSATVDGRYVHLKWNAVSGANGYIVYRSTSAYGTYDYIDATTGTTYDDIPSATGYNYYKVKAYNNTGQTSEYSSYVSCNYNYVNPPAAPSVTASGSSSSITISWTCTTNSQYGRPSKYEVHKNDPYTNEWNLLTTITSTSYTDRNVHPGKNWYIVKAINDAGSNWSYAYSNEIPLGKPSSFSASVSGSYIKCSWSKVAAATGYQIFYSTKASGDYYILKDIDDVNTTSCEIYYPASSGTTIYLKIKAYWMINNTNPVYSDPTTYKSVKF